jgi:hypothetical protein
MTSLEPRFEQSPEGVVFTFDIAGTPIRLSEDSTQYMAWQLVNGDAPVNPELDILE